jgi:hypothetical protein
LGKRKHINFSFPKQHDRDELSGRSGTVLTLKQISRKMGNEFQIAGPAYEKEVEPYFFDLILGRTSSGRKDKWRKELGGS